MKLSYDSLLAEKFKIRDKIPIILITSRWYWSSDTLPVQHGLMKHEADFFQSLFLWYDYYTFEVILHNQTSHVHMSNLI